jgi:tetratricopeptide (TPR) repeat protein
MNDSIRHRIVLSAVLLTAVVFAVTGCNESEKMSAVEKVLAEYRAMPVDEQEPALQELAASGPDMAAYGWYGLGNYYYERSQSDEAPRTVGARTGQNALLDSAVTYYEKAIAADSTMVEAWVNMGLIWDDISDGTSGHARKAVDLAKDAYTAAIVLAPTDEKARCNLGALHFRRHMYPEAIEQFNAVLEHDPDSALAHYNMAILFAESRMYREALVEWEAAADSDPDGDIGDRSRDNIKVIEDLMNSEIPAELTQGGH